MTPTKHSINHEAEIQKLRAERQAILSSLLVSEAENATMPLMDIDALIKNHTMVRLAECIMNNGK